MPAPSFAIEIAHYLLTLSIVYAWRRAIEHAAGPGGKSARRRGLVLGVALAWLGGTLALARAGLLYQPDASPPRFAFLMGPAVVGTIVWMLSPFGRTLARSCPLRAVIAFQLFRLPVELLLWELAREGVLPERMTFTGSNYDVLTALSAPIVAWIAGNHPSGARRALVLAWNVAGLALLANIAVIAARSMPGPWNAYPAGPANTIVLTSSFVWIPTVYVLTALASHVLVFRMLFARGERDA